MKLSKIIQRLEELAPPQLQEEYDNSGLQTGDPEMEIKAALLSLDCTEQVILEAARKKCNLVLCHHPVIFKPLRSLVGRNDAERTVMTAIRKNIAIYACHTNLDNVLNGVNGKIADQLGLVKRKVLKPLSGKLKKLVVFCPTAHAEPVKNALFAAGAGHIGNYSECGFMVSGIGSFKAGSKADPYVGKKGERHLEKEERIETIFPSYREDEVMAALLRVHPYEEVAFDIYPLSNAWHRAGSGLIGELDHALPEAEFLTWIRAVFGTSGIRHSSLRGKRIRRIALCGGAGAFLIPDALNAGADAFITGDVKYHEYFPAEGKMLILDVGHAESEQFTPSLFYEVIHRKFPKFAVHFSKTQTNPIHYF